MTTQMLNDSPRSESPLSAQAALRVAWACWVALFSVPFFVVLWFVWDTAGVQSSMPRAGQATWFVASLIYVALIAPAAFFWRDRVSKYDPDGKTMPPGKYLLGMISLWLTLVSAGLLSIVGCIVRGALLPNLVPSFFAMMLFLMLWPTRRALIHRESAWRVGTKGSGAR